MTREQWFDFTTLNMDFHDAESKTERVTGPLCQHSSRFITHLFSLGLQYTRFSLRARVCIYAFCTSVTASSRQAQKKRLSTPFCLTLSRSGVNKCVQSLCRVWDLHVVNVYRGKSSYKISANLSICYWDTGKISSCYERFVIAKKCVCIFSI